MTNAGLSAIFNNMRTRAVAKITIVVTLWTLDKSLYRGDNVGFTAEHAEAGKDRPTGDKLDFPL
jgi:hypothetical protein